MLSSFVFCCCLLYLLMLFVFYLFGFFLISYSLLFHSQTSIRRFLVIFPLHACSIHLLTHQETERSIIVFMFPHGFRLLDRCSSIQITGAFLESCFAGCNASSSWQSCHTSGRLPTYSSSNT